MEFFWNWIGHLLGYAIEQFLILIHLMLQKKKRQYSCENIWSKKFNIKDSYSYIYQYAPSINSRSYIPTPQRNQQLRIIPKRWFIVAKRWYFFYQQHTHTQKNTLQWLAICTKTFSSIFFYSELKTRSHKKRFVIFLSLSEEKKTIATLVLGRHIKKIHITFSCFIFPLIFRDQSSPRHLYRYT